MNSLVERPMKLNRRRIWQHLTSNSDCFVSHGTNQFFRLWLTGWHDCCFGSHTKKQNCIDITKGESWNSITILKTELRLCANAVRYFLWSYNPWNPFDYSIKQRSRSPSCFLTYFGNLLKCAYMSHLALASTAVFRREWCCCDCDWSALLKWFTITALATSSRVRGEIAHCHCHKPWSLTAWIRVIDRYRP